MPREEASQVEQTYRGSWGYNRMASERTLSAWSPAPGRKSGVAILLNLYSTTSELVPVLQDYWTQH